MASKSRITGTVIGCDLSWGNAAPDGSTEKLCKDCNLKGINRFSIECSDDILSGERAHIYLMRKPRK